MGTQPPKVAALKSAASEHQSGNWRQSKWLIVTELIVVALIFLADAHRLIPVSKTPFLLVFGWISLRVRKIGWRDVGLSVYRNWKTTFALGVAAGVLLEGLELFMTQPLLVRWLGTRAASCRLSANWRAPRGICRFTWRAT